MAQSLISFLLAHIRLGVRIESRHDWYCGLNVVVSSNCDLISFYQILRSVVAIVGLLELLGLLLELEGSLMALPWWWLPLTVLSCRLSSLQLLHYVCLSIPSYFPCSNDRISSTYMYLPKWELPQPEVNLNTNLTSSSSNREKWRNIVY